jgi:hypothetical protein
MKVKCLEIRDRSTMLTVMCFKPIPENRAQHFLMRHDGWSCSPTEHLVVVIDTHKHSAIYDCHEYSGGSRTMPEAHKYIEKNWDTLVDGDVVDVEYILGETETKKVSERFDT